MRLCHSASLSGRGFVAHFFEERRKMGGQSMNSESKRWQHIANMPIKPEEIFDLFEEMAQYCEKTGEKPGLDTALAILFEKYKKRKNAVERVFAISERLKCLVRLTKDKRMREWTRKTDDPDCIEIHSTVGGATARCTVKFEGNNSYFDPEEFFQIVQEQQEAESTEKQG
jgi:uncharacterized protein HemY